MALRLQDASSLPAPGDARPPDARIAERAQALLDAREVKAYRALFAEAAAVEDPHRRYSARRKLMELGLGAAGAIPDAAVPGLFAAVARAGLDALDENPREPTLLNLAGVALYELGTIGPAETLFRAATRLDPTLPHVARNLEEIARRRGRGAAISPLLPRHLRAALPAIGRRAEEVARRARPAEGLTLSLCMIVKDEEEMLPRCLEAIRPAVDEIVVVDTGSSDRTIEIARSFGAKVIEHPWTGSFSEPRNVSFDAASGDWIVYLDADEVLVGDDAERLRALTGRTWREAFYLVETNFTGDLEDGTAVTHNALRVFRNRPEYRFEGRIHEQIAHNLPAYLPERLEVADVRVEHYGYLGAVRDAKEKSRRNSELLERQLAEGGDSPFLHFNLGSEYAAAGDSRAALESFKAAWDRLRDDPLLASFGFVPSLMDRLVTALRVTGDLDGATRQADEFLAIFPDFTDLVLEQAHAARAGGDSERAIELFERCLEMGDAPSRYSSTVGCGTYLALTGLADMRRARRELEQAERLLGRCLSEHPRYLGVVEPLSAVMLARGREPGAVVAQIEEQLETVTPSARFMLGTSLYEAGHAGHAETQFRAVLERQPGSEPVRVALSEALLSQSRWEEAAEVAAAVP
ncbi:MAG: glycosyltransferase, partial [Actinomycetota bacterium]|nr:glycosyltransferase [Actinomycetota bacterium]